MKALGTKHRIREAALRLFSDKGYLGATTREIARVAGVAEVTLFRHFPSKERLFEEVIRSYTFLPALKGILPELEGLGAEEALREIARRFLALLSTRRDLVRIMLSQMPSYPATVRDIYHQFTEEMFGTLASYFSRLRERGLFGDVDPQMAARAFFAMFIAYVIREFLVRGHLKKGETERVIEAFVNIFALGVLRRQGPHRRPGSRSGQRRQRGKSTGSATGGSA